MALTEIEENDGVTIIRLTNGVTNPISLDLIKEISKSLDDLKDDPDTLGVVLTGSNDKFFSIGFDLPNLYKHGKDEMRTFYRSYNRLSLNLYSYPKPTVAALTGHAIAGGCILALCCDYRVIASGKKLMGLNEVKLGVPVPYPGDLILKQTIGTRYAQMLMEVGDFYEADALMQMGMVNDVVRQKGVLEKAVDHARLLGKYPPMAFRMIKKNRVEEVKENILKNLDEKEQYFLKCWFSDETRKLLKEATKKF
jgi:enoyl-CoA hydratase/carnithine racemase